MTKTNMTDYVTKQCGTEPAFNNAYWNEHRPGISVDVNTGEVLFSSLDKFDSGTGWPSFTKPLEQLNIIKKKNAKSSKGKTMVFTGPIHTQKPPFSLVSISKALIFSLSAP